MDPNEAWKIFIDHLGKYLDAKCPIKRNIFRREKPEWMIPEVARLMRDRDATLKMSQKDR